MMIDVNKKHFGEIQYSDPQTLLYGDFTDSSGNYKQMDNIQIVTQKVQEALFYYNE